MVTDKKLGFIGAGNMGEALFKGLLSTRAAKPEQIIVSARRPERVQELVKAHGVRGGGDAEVARASGRGGVAGDAGGLPRGGGGRGGWGAARISGGGAARTAAC